MPSINHYIKRIISVCLSLSFFFLTLEVSARLDDKIKYDAPFFEQYSSERLKVRDSDGIGHNVPNSCFEKWKINNFGFRGPEISIKKPKDTLRIICMGSSETFGLYESPEKEWASQLMNYLEELKKPRFQVINSSVAGLTLKNYKSYLEKYVLKFKPDIIILYINPFFSLGRLEKISKETTAPDNNKKQNNFSIKELISNLRILPKTKQTIKKIIPLKLLKKYQLKNNLKLVRLQEQRYLNGEKAIDVVSKGNLDILRSDLVKFIKFLKDKNINVILSSYPVLFSQRNMEKYPEILLDYRRFCIYYSLKGMIDISVKYNKMIEMVANEYQCGFVDNYKILGDDIEYFGDAVHYTDKGAELIAQNFADFIKTRKRDFALSLVVINK